MAEHPIYHSDKQTYSSYLKINELLGLQRRGLIIMMSCCSSSVIRYTNCGSSR